VAIHDVEMQPVGTGTAGAFGSRAEAGVVEASNEGAIIIATIFRFNFSASDWHHRLRLGMNRPAQVTGHQIDRHGRQHQKSRRTRCASPRWRASPIRRMILVNRAAIRIAVRLVIVLLIHS